MYKGSIAHFRRPKTHIVKETAAFIWAPENEREIFFYFVTLFICGNYRYIGFTHWTWRMNTNSSEDCTTSKTMDIHNSALLTRNAASYVYPHRHTYPETQVDAQVLPKRSLPCDHLSHWTEPENLKQSTSPTTTTQLVLIEKELSPLFQRPHTVHI